VKCEQLCDEEKKTYIAVLLVGLLLGDGCYPQVSTHKITPSFDQLDVLLMLLELLLSISLGKKNRLNKETLQKV